MSPPSRLIESCLWRRRSPEDASAGETLVLVHGAGSQSGGFQALADHLFHFRFASPPIAVETIDLPGHGGAPDAPLPESIDDHAARIIAVLETRPAPVFLAGHSMGGAIAQVVARQRPELIRGLILMATADRLKVSEAILAGIAADYEGFLKASESFLFGPATPLAWRRAMIFGAFLPPPSAAVTHADFRACAGYDARDETARITAPALVISGRDDLMIPEKASLALADRLPEARALSVAGAGHLVFLEECGGVARAIDAFIADIASP